MVEWTFRYTNLPFLLLCGALEIVVVRRWHVALPWFASRAETPKHALAYRLGSAGFLALLYGEAARRFIGGAWDWPHPARVVEIVALTPLVEEVLFRGLLWEACGSRTIRYGEWRSQLVTSVSTALAFAAWHVPAGGTNNLIGHAFFGLAMAFVRLGSGALAPCVILHALGNLLTLSFEGAR